MCGQPRLAELDRCIDCVGTEWSFRGIEGWGTYGEPSSELVRGYKRQGLRVLAGHWASTLAGRLVPAGPLVPVPPLRSHLWIRGWDPVEVLARSVAREAGLPVWSLLVRRRSLAQKTLDKAGRWKNAHLAYGLRSGASRRLATGPVVWLVDDVVTTGATVEACSKILRDAGAVEVRVLCLGLH